MKTEVHPDTLSFIIAGFVAEAMNLNTRAFDENSASRCIYLPIFTLI
jgi:hypothetical protein